MTLRRPPHRYSPIFCALLALFSGVSALALEAQVVPANAKRTIPGLCDPEGAQSTRSGYGAPIATWPRLTDPPSPEYQAKAKAYIEDRTQKVLTDFSKAHASYPATTDKAKPDLTPSLAARKQFFDLSFGTAAATICQAKKSLAEDQVAFEAAKTKKNAEKGADVNACADADKAMLQTYQKAQVNYGYYSKVIEQRLKGFRDKDNRAVMGLEDAFPKYRQENRANLDKWKSTIEKEAGAGKVGELETEFIAHWGSAPVGGSAPIEPNGFFSSFLLETRKEIEVAKLNEKFFEENKGEFERLKKNCGSLTAMVLTAKVTDPENGDITGLERTKKPDPIAAAVIAEEEERIKSGSPRVGRREVPEPATTRTREEEIPDTTDRGPGSREKIPPNKGGATSGVSGTTVAAGLVAAGLIGGGIYYLHKKEKKRRKKEEAENEAFLAQLNAPRPSTTTTVTETVTVGPGGSAPAGAKLILVNAINGAQTGTAMEKIDLTLVDANGRELAVNGLAVEASCYSPQPCSLTGGKSVTTVNGKVTFDSLRFNQPDRGVKLQFSAPGVPTLVQPNAFDVGGEAPRL